MRKVLKWLLPIAGLWIIGLGFNMMFRPLTSLVTFSFFVGFGILFTGISEVSSYIGTEKEKRSGMFLASGILAILFGTWILFGRGAYAITIILPFIFAAWVLSSSVARIVDAVSTGVKGKVWELVLGILSTIASFMLLFNPFLSARFVGLIIGAMLIAHGCGTIELFMQLRRADKISKDDAKRLKARIEQAEQEEMLSEKGSDLDA